MLYAIYLPDGSIQQANKVFDPAGLKYDDLLNEREMKFIKRPDLGVCSHDHYFVDVAAQELCERPVMPIVVSKAVIRCGDADSVLLTAIPKGSTYSVLAGGAKVYPPPGSSNLLDGDELEISMPVPCTFRIVLDKWPYKSFAADIEVVA